MKRILSLLLFAAHIVSEKALVIAPVIDLTTHPTNENIPAAPKNYLSGACPRIHQAIFNEIVDIKTVSGRNAKIEISNTFTQNNEKTKEASYWCSTKNLLFLSKLDATLIPDPIDFNKKADYSKETLVLTNPFYAKETGLKYSAGTRFVLKDGLAQIYDKNSKEFLEIEIPQKYWIKEKNRTYEEKLKIFCNLLENWASQKNECIPYIWGGCSFVKTYKNNFNEKGEVGKEFYEVAGCDSDPKTGFDCSGVILRAAQISGFDYYFKNTSTILKNLTPTKDIKNGAILVWPGHVIVITDSNKGMMVEAGGYSCGFGCLHKIKLQDFFEGIKSTIDLEKAIKKNRPLLRLNPSKEVVQKIQSIKCFKI